MDKKDRRLLYKTAVKCYGEEDQIAKAVEEIGELLNALAKHHFQRATIDEVIDELADVSIIIECVADMINWKDFETRKEYKLNRLRKRLDDIINNSNK